MRLHIHFRAIALLALPRGCILLLCILKEQSEQQQIVFNNSLHHSMMLSLTDGFTDCYMYDCLVFTFAVDFLTALTMFPKLEIQKVTKGVEKCDCNTLLI